MKHTRHSPKGWGKSKKKCSYELSTPKSENIHLINEPKTTSKDEPGQEKQFLFC